MKKLMVRVICMSLIHMRWICLRRLGGNRQSQHPKEALQVLLLGKIMVLRTRNFDLATLPTSLIATAANSARLLRILICIQYGTNMQQESIQPKTLSFRGIGLLVKRLLWHMVMRGTHLHT